MKSFAVNCLILLLTAFHLQAQKSEIFVKDSIAVKGYDVVAYFTQSAPVKGNSEFVHTWKGGKWYFANRENQEAFKASPEKYAPQYGGYCAYGTADGHKAPTDPKIVSQSLLDNLTRQRVNFVVKKPVFIAAFGQNDI
ncbi:YHS domain-containing (seleno)protein [Runella sp.]|jgi:YHS domain-containing protein|uniref:YHS domain-containing (seleno)protein n=1 Tax=Runella sp. TaxID=1960881 RepID=UPI0030167C23